MELEISKIRTDGGTQSRAELRQDVIKEYADEMKAGAIFPAIVTFYDGSDYWIADGFHRLEAARLADLGIIGVEVRQGTRRDAILFSVGANAIHGLRRTNADKDRSVNTLLSDPEWSKWSDNEIARRAGVAQSTVSRMRGKLDVTYAMNKSTTRTGADGRTINTAKIGRKPAADAGQVNSPSPVAPAPTPQPAPVEDSYYTDLRSWLTRTYKPDAWIGILAHGKFPAWMMNDRGYEKAARRLTGELQAERAEKAAQEAEHQPVAPPAASLVAPILTATRTVGEVVPVFRSWLATFSIEDQITMLQEVERRTAEGSGIINQIMDEAGLVDVRLSTAFAACQSILNTIRLAEREGTASGEGGANGETGSGNGGGNGGGSGAYPFVAVTDPADLLAISEAVEAMGTLRKDIETAYAILNILAKRKGFYLNEQEGQYEKWVGKAEASLATARQAVDRVSEMARAAIAG